MVLRWQRLVDEKGHTCPRCGTAEVEFVIITLCGHAEANCPLTPPGIKRLHWPLEDPAQATGTEEEILNAFRKVRDEIKERILNFIEEVRNAPYMGS